MAIRIESLSGENQYLDQDQQQQKVQSAALDLRETVQNSDLEAFQEQLKEFETWDDIHCALQIDKEAWAILAAYHHDSPRVWSEFFWRFGEHLHSRLKKNPLEPVLWQLLGMIMFELGLNRAADDCCKVILRFQPEDREARVSRKKIKARQKAGTPRRPFDPGLIRACEVLAKQVSALAKRTNLPSPEAIKLSLAMIVKNEEQALPGCLDSVSGLVDEVIIVDTGSEDRTVEIAEEYGAKVVHFPWTGSFAEARNISLDHASGDWILHLDADEQLLPEQHGEIRSNLSKLYLEGMMLTEYNYTGASKANDQIAQHSTMRIWRNRPQYRFQGVIHEQRVGMPMWLADRFRNTEWTILHFGYLKEVIRAKNKNQRNMDLLFAEAEKDPSPFNRFNLGNEYLSLQDFGQALHYYDLAFNQLITENKNIRTIGYTPFLLTRRTRAARMSGDLGKATEYANLGLDYFPDSNSLIMEKAYLAELQGDTPGAINYAKQSINKGEAPAGLGGSVGEGSFLARNLLGNLLERQGEFQQAVSVYQESLANDPHYLAVLGGLARALLMQGESPENILVDLEQYLEKDPVNAGTMIATSFYERQHIAEALDLYHRVESANKDNPIARVGIVECLLSQGEFDQVLQICGNLEEPDPVAHILLRSAVFCQIMLGELAEAKILLGRAQELGLDPMEQTILADWLSVLLGDWPESWDLSLSLMALPFLEASLRLKQIDAAQAMIRLYHHSTLTAAQLARAIAPVYARQGYLDSAAECWLHWIDQDGPQADSLVGLAYISWAEQRPEEALALAQDAVTLDPEHPEAQRMVAAFSSPGG